MKAQATTSVITFQSWRRRYTAGRQKKNDNNWMKEEEKSVRCFLMREYGWIPLKNEAGVTATGASFFHFFESSWTVASNTERTLISHSPYPGSLAHSIPFLRFIPFYPILSTLPIYRFTKMSRCQ